MKKYRVNKYSTHRLTVMGLLSSYNKSQTIWYGNSLFDTTYKYTHLNILHN